MKGHIILYPSNRIVDAIVRLEPSDGKLTMTLACDLPQPPTPIVYIDIYLDGHPYARSFIDQNSSDILEYMMGNAFTMEQRVEWLVEMKNQIPVMDS